MPRCRPPFAAFVCGLAAGSTSSWIRPITCDRGPFDVAITQSGLLCCAASRFDQFLTAIDDLIFVDPPVFSRRRNDPVPQLRPVGTFAFTLANHRDFFAFCHLNLPAIAAGASQMSADPGNRSIFAYSTGISGVVKVNGFRLDPTETVLRRTNAQPPIVSFRVDLKCLSVAKWIRAIIVVGWTTTRVRFFFDDVNGVRFKREITLSLSGSRTKRDQYERKRSQSYRLHREYSGGRGKPERPDQGTFHSLDT